MSNESIQFIEKMNDFVYYYAILVCSLLLCIIEYIFIDLTEVWVQIILIIFFGLTNCIFIGCLVKEKGLLNEMKQQQIGLQKYSRIKILKLCYCIILTTMYIEVQYPSLFPRSMNYLLLIVIYIIIGFWESVIINKHNKQKNK